MFRLPDVDDLPGKFGVLPGKDSEPPPPPITLMMEKKMA